MLTDYILLLCDMKKCHIGEPVYYTGLYKDDNVYDLYIQRISCSFKVKENHIPTIQIKKHIFNENEYLESSDGEIVELTLTSVDLKLFEEHYEIYDRKDVDGWKFKSITGIFNEYIDKWIEVKNQATITGNVGQRTIAKLMLNSLYGKLGKSLTVQSKNPYITEDGIIKYSLGDEEESNGIYLPMASFITAYARNKTIRISQAIKTWSIQKYGVDKYCYSDTDSVHCLLSIDELKQFCEIDDVKLGAWKHEGSFSRARFIRQKCYIEEMKGKLKITCAGMSKKCYNNIKWEDFKPGLKVPGNLKITHVKGGVKLVDSEFTLKERKM